MGEMMCGSASTQIERSEKSSSWGDLVPMVKIESMSHLRSRKHTMVEDPIEFIIEDLTVATRLPF